MGTQGEIVEDPRLSRAITHLCEVEGVWPSGEAITPIDKNFLRRLAASVEALEDRIEDLKEQRSALTGQ